MGINVHDLGMDWKAASKKGAFTPALCQPSVAYNYDDAWSWVDRSSSPEQSNQVGSGGLDKFARGSLRGHAFEGGPWYRAVSLLALWGWDYRCSTDWLHGREYICLCMCMYVSVIWNEKCTASVRFEARSKIDLKWTLERCSSFHWASILHSGFGSARRVSYKLPAGEELLQVGWWYIDKCRR